MKPMPGRLILQAFTNDKWNSRTSRSRSFGKRRSWSIEWEAGRWWTFCSIGGLQAGPRRASVPDADCAGEADGVATHAVSAVPRARAKAERGCAGVAV